MRLRLRYIATMVVMLLLSINTNTEARWASTADMVYKIKKFNSVINVKKSGETEEEISIEYEVLKENGRYAFAQYALGYNSDNGSLKVIEAKTIYNGKEYKVGKDLIEDKPVASNPNGFDEMRRVNIAFPNVKVGAKVFIKYKLTTLHAPIDGYFSATIPFGKHQWLESSSIKINSEIPLYHVCNDPHQVLNISSNNKDKQGRVTQLDIKLKKPILQAVVGEYMGSELALVPNHDQFTWVSMSSVNSWEPLAHALSKDYEKVYTEKLPKPFVDVLNAAKKYTNEVDQINAVTSMLNDKVQYMGDRRTIKGRMIPRDLKVIAERQLGDCKDFSASTAAILTAMGYKANIAMVWRGLETQRSNRALPSLAAFNHAMLKVVSPSGKTYWVDPTNIVSMAGGIFADIAEKPALVLDQEHSKYLYIPQVDVQRAKVDIQKTLEVCNKREIQTHIKATLHGESAVPYTGMGLFLSKEMIENNFYRLISGTELEDSGKLKAKIPALKTRIVKSIPIELSFKQDNLLTLTNAGLALGLNYKVSVISELINLNETNISDVFINNMRSERLTMLVKNTHPKNIEALNKVIDSPWLRLSRMLQQTPEGVNIVYEYVVKRPVIYSQEFRSSEFKELKHQLKQFFTDVFLLP